MKTQTGKLLFTYQAISKLESEVNKQRDINSELIKALEPFINGCYSGCSKDQLNEYRIAAEKLLKSLQ